MQNPVVITILAIILSSLLIAYIRRVTKDRCLKAFQNDYVTLLLSDQREISGRLVVESTGIEVVYDIQEFEDEPKQEGDVFVPELHHASFILFKTEFGQLTAILRRHDDLSDIAKEKRKKEVQLAPFLKSHTIEDLIMKAMHDEDHPDWDIIRKLAPFAPGGVLDKLVPVLKEWRLLSPLIF